MAQKSDAELINEANKIFELMGNYSASQYETFPSPKPSRRTLASRFGTWSAVVAACKGAPTEVSETLKEVFSHPKFLDMKVNKLDAFEWLKMCENLKEKFSETEFGQQIATIQIDTDRPVAIAYAGDWHLGSSATDYKEFRENLEFLLKTPNLYLVAVGDTIDNFVNFPDKSTLLSQILPADKQKMLFEAILKELLAKKKILAVGWGDHDVKFEERLSGSPVLEHMVRNKVPYFPGRGLMKLQIGEQTYTNVVAHRSRYSSYLNEVWSSSQEYRLFFPADVVITAHLHSPAYAVVNRYPIAREAGYAFGGEAALIRTGTYKIEDRYSMRYWNKGVIGVPTVVYYPDKFLFDVYRSAERAVELGLKRR